MAQYCPNRQSGGLRRRVSLESLRSMELVLLPVGLWSAAEQLRVITRPAIAQYRSDWRQRLHSPPPGPPCFKFRPNGAGARAASAVAARAPGRENGHAAIWRASHLPQVCTGASPRRLACAAYVFVHMPLRYLRRYLGDVCIKICAARPRGPVFDPI